MLAYVFWHHPRPEVDVPDYEEAQRSFHSSLESPSASFRLDVLPFEDGSGYEDWYLVEDWQGLGALNQVAVDAAHGPSHDRVATMVGEGWGAVYELVRGTAGIPEGVEWLDKPRGEPSTRFIDSLPHDSVWRRQLVLGPAPEFCLAVPDSTRRQQI
jgi:hypothetical protein